MSYKLTIIMLSYLSDECYGIRDYSYTECFLFIFSLSVPYVAINGQSVALYCTMSFCLKSVIKLFYLKNSDHDKERFSRR